MYFSIILSFLLISPNMINSNIKCDEVDVSYVKKDASGAEYGQIEIDLDGYKGEVYYVFYYPSGHLVTQEVSKPKLEELKPGKYYCSVVYGSGCTKKIEFEINEIGG